MGGLFNSWVFNVLKAAIAATVAGILAAAAHGDTTLPLWLAPLLAALGGALQVGQKK